MNRKLHLLAIVFLLIGFLSNQFANAQITTAGDCFLKGRFVEVGVCPSGAYGSANNTPSGGGYHGRPGDMTSKLGFVADPDMDGWSTGTPGYIGDYFLPGSPQEGWDIQIDGDRMGGWRGGGSDLRALPFGGATSLTGENVEYDTIGTKIYGIWSGVIEDYNLEIRITTSLDTNKVYFIGNVVLKNTGTVDLEKVFFNRTVDPDNEASTPGCGDFSTENVIVYQPDSTDLKCLVSAKGQCFDSYLGLGAKDCRAKSYIIVGDGLNPNQDPEEIYNGETDYLTGDGSNNGGLADTLTQDTGVGVVFNLGTIAAGDSVTLSYAYILREADLDSAFAELGASFVLDGSTLASGDSTVRCVGYEMDVAITGASDFTWETWTPSTGLEVTSGPINTITVGTDSITYRITGVSTLCNQRDTLYLTVVPIIVPPPGVDSGGSICANASPVSLFEYLGGDPPTTGTWAGPGTTATGIFDPSSVGMGLHDIVYSVYIDGCLATNTVTMNVYNYVDVDFDWDLHKGCANDTVHFTNNSEVGTYRWNFADATPPDTAENPIHVFEEQNEYGVWLVVRNLDGCIDSIQKLVDTKHPLEAIFSMDVDSICQNRNIAFLDNSIGSIQQWNWDFGDGNTSTTQSPTHNYTLAGYHTVRLIVTDDVPCSDTTYRNVYIDSIPSLEILTDKTEICNGERINMSLDFLYTANGFTWDFGDGTGLEDGSGTTFHSYNAPGEYIMQVRSHHPVCADAVAYDTFTVKPYPVVNLGPDTTLCLNGAPLFISSEGAVPAGTSWMWSTGDTTSVLKVVHPGTYIANAVLDGCTGSDEITVTKDCYTDVPNSFTPNGDGNNDYFFPRQLVSKGVVAFNMTVFDRWGQKIFESNSVDGRGWDGKFNDKDQPVGVYIYMINVVFENNTSEKYTGNVTLIR